METKNLTPREIKKWLSPAIDALLGPVSTPKLKDYIIPLLFLKRLSDVSDDNREKLLALDIRVPKEAHWNTIASLKTNIGEAISKALLTITRQYPQLQKAFEIFDFNPHLLPDSRLQMLIKTLSRYRLGYFDVEPDFLGRVYEILLFYYGREDTIFYTPKEVATLMATILDPQPGETIYDPACGSGGLLIHTLLKFRETHEAPNITPPTFFGQEIDPFAYVIAHMNAIIHGMPAVFALGDTLKAPAFLSQGGSSLRRFHKIIANPPWCQPIPNHVYKKDQYGRFCFGIPPNSNADWGWIQHMFASLHDDGKLVSLIDTGAASRSDNREVNIRKTFIENDLLEACILLPEKLFYNTPSPSMIIVINKAKKPKEGPLFIDASKAFSKEKNHNYLTKETISQIIDIYRSRRKVKTLIIASKVVPAEEIASSGYNLRLILT